MKLTRTREMLGQQRSHPARGAWIEITALATTNVIKAVAPRTGCVD